MRGANGRVVAVVGSRSCSFVAVKVVAIRIEVRAIIEVVVVVRVENISGCIFVSHYRSVSAILSVLLNVLSRRMGLRGVKER